MSANITPTAMSDGVPYAVSVPLTSTEADLFGGTGAVTPDPTAVSFNAAIIAVVQLSINGLITGNNTYIVMQMDCGDDVWIDINWAIWNGTQGSAVFVFSNGVAGANTFQQTRQSNSSPSPQANGSNQVVLAGRIRFVGKTLMNGGSSSLSGVTTAVSATIRYKMLALR